MGEFVFHFPPIAMVIEVGRWLIFSSKRLEPNTLPLGTRRVFYRLHNTAIFSLCNLDIEANKVYDRAPRLCNAALDIETDLDIETSIHGDSKDSNNILIYQCYQSGVQRVTKN